MSQMHLSQDQLIDVLYGVAASEQHLDACAECQARLAMLGHRREQSAKAADLPANFYHQQRRRILDRLSQPARPSLSPVWVPAAVAALMAVGLMLSRPVTAPKPRPHVSTTAEVREASFEECDNGWFEDTYTEMQVSEPRAFTPMRSLFAEGVVKE